MVSCSCGPEDQSAMQENQKLEQENQRVIALLATNAKSENRGVMKDILSNVERLQRAKAKVLCRGPRAWGRFAHCRATSDWSAQCRALKDMARQLRCTRSRPGQLEVA